MDTHKVAAILTMILLVIGFGMMFGVMGPEIAAEEHAAEKAANLYSEDDINTYLEVSEFIEEETARKTAGFDWLVSMGVLLLLIGIVASIISGITAFSIPKRYLKEPLTSAGRPKFLRPNIKESERMTAEIKVKEEKRKQAIYLAIASIVCGFIGLFIFGMGLGLAGVFLGYGAVKQGSKLGYIGLIFGVIVFMLSMISIWL